jgi:oligopeptide/dipeptide ABC transporter ATP-binding protein
VSAAAVPLLELEDLTVSLASARARRRGAPPAVGNVDLAVGEREVVGIVGESGAGKSTIGLTVVGRHRATGGRIRFAGRDVTRAGRAELKALRHDVQMVFQDPYGSLPPHLRVADVVTEPLVIHGELSGRRRDRDRRTERAAALLAECGLPEGSGDKTAEQFSGGQRQRIAIARALALRPRLLIADEPTSALDVSVQAQILDLLRALQAEHGMAMVFVSHNLAVVQQMATRIVVLQAGRVAETGPTDRVFADPRHPYTQALIDSVASPDPAAERAARAARRTSGRVNVAGIAVTGCPYALRCPLAEDRCHDVRPALEPAGAGGPDEAGAAHLAACLRLDVTGRPGPTGTARATGITGEAPAAGDEEAEEEGEEAEDGAAGEGAADARSGSTAGGEGGGGGRRSERADRVGEATVRSKETTA